MHGEHLRLRFQSDFAASSFDHIEHASQAFVKATSFGGRLHAPIAPMKQRPAEILLEFLDLMTDRRLRQMQLVRREREALKSCRGLECAQQNEVRDTPHGYSLGMNACHSSMNRHLLFFGECVTNMNAVETDSSRPRRRQLG